MIEITNIRLTKSLPTERPAKKGIGAMPAIPNCDGEGVPPLAQHEVKKVDADALPAVDQKTQILVHSKEPSGSVGSEPGEQVEGKPASNTDPVPIDPIQRGTLIENNTRFVLFDFPNQEIKVRLSEPSNNSHFQMKVLVGEDLSLIWVDRKNFIDTLGKDKKGVLFILNALKDLTAEEKTQLTAVVEPLPELIPSVMLYSRPKTEKALTNPERIKAIQDAIQKCSPETLSKSSSPQREFDVTAIQELCDFADQVGENTPAKIPGSMIGTHKDPTGRSILVGQNGRKYLLLTRCQIRNDKKIGNGSFKVVKFAIDLDTGAVKALAIAKAGNKAHRDECEREIRLLSLCNDLEETVHLDLAARCFDPAKQTVKYYMIMDYCEEGDLRSHIPLPDPEKLDPWIDEILNGMCNLHLQKELIHCDIKPENILIQNGHIKIADFGGSVKIKNAADHLKGTLLYIAPEMLLDHNTTPGCDMWSTGCTIYELITGRQLIGDLLGKYYPDEYQEMLNEENDDIYNWKLIKLITNLFTSNELQRKIDRLILKVPKKYREVLKCLLTVELKSRIDLCNEHIYPD